MLPVGACCRPAPFTDESKYLLARVEISCSQVCLVLTSLAMLKNLLHSRKLEFGGFFSLDGKHKLTWNGFPVIPMGTCDADQHFMGVAYAIVSHENSEMFERILWIVFLSAQREFPTFDGLMAFGESDNDDAIGNAAFRFAKGQMSGVEWQWLNCYMHLTVCNIEKKGATLNKLLHNDEERDKILAILKALAGVAWPTVFEAGMRLFIDELISLESDMENTEWAAAFIKEYYPQGAAQFNAHCHANSLPGRCTS